MQLHPGLNSTHAPGFVILSDRETCREKTPSQNKVCCKLPETDSIINRRGRLISITNLRMYKLSMITYHSQFMFMVLSPTWGNHRKVDTNIFGEKSGFCQTKKYSLFFGWLPKHPQNPGEVPKMTRIFDAVHICMCMCMCMYVYICVYIYISWKSNHHFS